MRRTQCEANKLLKDEILRMHEQLGYENHLELIIKLNNTTTKQLYRIRNSYIKDLTRLESVNAVVETDEYKRSIVPMCIDRGYGFNNKRTKIKRNQE